MAKKSKPNKKVRVITVNPKPDEQLGHTFTLDWDALDAALDERARAGGHSRPPRRRRGRSQPR